VSEKVESPIVLVPFFAFTTIFPNESSTATIAWAVPEVRKGMLNDWDTKAVDAEAEATPIGCK
jgi:hypothetical protein